MSTDNTSSESAELQAKEMPAKEMPAKEMPEKERLEAARVSTEKANLEIQKKPIEIFGHRGVGCSIAGGKSTVPENSMAAFQKAYELGLTGVELDVWLTKDEQVIVIHGGGSDIDGFLFETVVEIEEKEDTTPAFSPPALPTPASQTPALQTPASQPSQTSFSSTPKSMESPSGTTTSVVRRLRRIEDIKFAEFRAAGLMRHRRPWMDFSNRLGPNGLPNGAAERSRRSENGFPISENEFPISENEFQNGFPIGSPMEGSVTSFARPGEDPVANEEIRRIATSNLSDCLDYQKDAIYYVDSEHTVSEVPLLSEVFERFHGKLIFNVELKGTNPRLGPAVLEIAKPFPGIIARISSFLWNPDTMDFLTPSNITPSHPSLLDASSHLQTAFPDSSSHLSLLGVQTSLLDSSAELMTVGEEAELCIVTTEKLRSSIKLPIDLVSPLIKNSFGIPLALLFDGYRVPAVKSMIKHLRKYDAHWVHLPQSFEIDGDGEKAASLKSEFLKNPRIGELLNRIPCDRSVDYEACRDKLLSECLNLFFACREFHREGIKVLIYGGHDHENKVTMELCFYCGIDGICPNDVQTTLALAELWTISHKELATD